MHPRNRRAQVDSLGFDLLESRTLLVVGFNFPTLAMLEDPDNAVVRLETRYGVVDIELFGADAPLATAGFLGITSDYDGTFLHRLTTGESLAGGVFTFDDAAGLGVRGSTFGVDPAFARPNEERTLAVRVETGSTTSTGEWAINLADNSGATNWLVIGRVIQGWEVIQQIAGLNVADLSAQFPGQPAAAGLTSVPVTGPPPTSVTEADLVFASDFELIKPAGQPGFFEHRIYYPEGYSWERIYEAIELVNPGADTAHYQVVVRYETGTRDDVIATGTLAGDRRTTILVSPLGARSTVVRNDVPYAYEVWSTQPLAGGFRHSDFGSGVGEAFFNPASLPDQNAMREWTFTQAALGFGGSQVFIVWQNTTGTDTTVTLTLYFENADPLVITEALEGHRRGGINIHELTNLPAGAEFVGARVQATEPIVASITRYDDRSTGEGGDEGGIAALGAVGGGSTEGVAPGARRGGLDPTAVLNTGTEPAVITFYVSEEGSTLAVQRVVTVPAGRLAVLEGDDNPAAAATPGKFFTIRYESDVPVTVGVLTSAFRGTGSGFATAAAEVTHFADARAFTSPSGSPFGQQGVSIYNPGSTGAAYRIIFRFSDGSRAESEEFSIGGGLAAHHRMNSFNQLISGVLGGLGGYAQAPYSIELVGSAPLVVQAVQLNGDGKAELGTTVEPWLPLSTIG